MSFEGSSTAFLRVLAPLNLIPGLPRWTPEEKLALAKILHAKQHSSEARYLHLMQRHPRLRATFLALGSLQQ